MSHSIENQYLGELRTHSTHLKSSDTITTDAPIDNNGRGDAFSPTDLVASALCSCMTTVMGICAKKNNFELPRSTAYVTKIMDSHPRRISKIIIDINFDNNDLSDQQTEKLVAVAKGCPVAQSLSSDLIQEVKFNF
ncbi:MAG: osmotically inducible protein OsmC [Flavobacteriaceae bacterium]|nr:osmotically inducible protein OsmC [Flavobacteriaceae bacterium]|tara:strand:- start:3940 stop:4347 length:408 start_codon:yes stop_codon:yes gene_type:complete